MWHCSQLLLSTGLAAVDLYLLPMRPTAVNPLHAAAVADRWDRQTDTIPLHRPCSTVVSIIHWPNLSFILTNYRMPASLNHNDRKWVYNLSTTKSKSNAGEQGPNLQNILRFIVRLSQDRLTIVTLKVLKFLLGISYANLRTLSQTILQLCKWIVPKKSLAPFVGCFVN